MIYAELRKAVAYHLIGGIILSAMITSGVVLYRYEKSISDAIKRLEIIRVNTMKLGQSIQQMDSVMEKINAMLPADYDFKSHREVLFLALDDIKTYFGGSEITVTSLDEKAAELALPVNIKVTVDNYTVLIKRIGYLQSLNFPFFSIKTLAIEKTEAATICRIEGVLKMPAEKLKAKKV